MIDETAVSAVSSGLPSRSTYRGGSPTPSMGEVVYLAWLGLIAFAWVVVPMLVLLSGR